MLFSNNFENFQKLSQQIIILRILIHSLNRIEDETWQHCNSDHSFIALSLFFVRFDQAFQILTAQN